MYVYIYMCIYMCILYCTIHRSYRYFLLNMLLCVSVCNIAYIQLALQLETNFVIEWIGESLTTFKTELFKQNTKNSVTASQKAYRLNHVPPIFLHHPTARRLTQVIPIISSPTWLLFGVPRFLFRQKKIHSLGPICEASQRSQPTWCFPMGRLPNLPNIHRPKPLVISPPFS